MNESSFQGVADYKIFTRSWIPEGGKPRGVVVMVHGVNEHSGYWSWAADQLIANGLAAYALDLRGRGKSDGERFYVQKVEDYENDVAKFITLIKAEQPGLPVFLLGHSAGGVVSCIYTLDHQAELAGFICESFAYQLPAPGFAIAALKGLAHIAPHAHVLKLKNEDFSRDPKVVEQMNNDPLIANETQPTQTVAALAMADDRLKKNFQEITIPLLILHGTADHATKPSGSQEFYDKAGSTDKTLKLYEGHFHDLLNDLDKEVVMADILQWINNHISVPETIQSFESVKVR